MAATTNDQTDQAEPTSGDGADRRVWRRFSAGELLNVTARLATGGQIVLVDLSRGGARLQSSRRMLPGSTLSLRLVTPDATFTIAGQVVRSRIVQLAEGGLGYDLAIAFHDPLQQVPLAPGAESSAARTPRPEGPAAGPEAEHPYEPSSLVPSEPPVPGDEPAEARDLAADTADTGEPLRSDPTAPLTNQEIAANAAAVADELGESAKDTDEWSSSMFHVTAMLNSPADQIRDLFEGNDW